MDSLGAAAHHVMEDRHVAGDAEIKSLIQPPSARILALGHDGDGLATLLPAAFDQGSKQVRADPGPGFQDRQEIDPRLRAVGSEGAEAGALVHDALPAPQRVLDPAVIEFFDPSTRQQWVEAEAIVPEIGGMSSQLGFWKLE